MYTQIVQINKYYQNRRQSKAPAADFSAVTESQPFFAIVLFSSHMAH